MGGKKDELCVFQQRGIRRGVFQLFHWTDRKVSLVTMIRFSAARFEIFRTRTTLQTCLIDSRSRSVIVHASSISFLQISLQIDEEWCRRNSTDFHSHPLAMIIPKSYTCICTNDVLYLGCERAFYYVTKM